MPIRKFSEVNPSVYLLAVPLLPLCSVLQAYSLQGIKKDKSLSDCLSERVTTVCSRDRKGRSLCCLEATVFCLSVAFLLKLTSLFCSLNVFVCKYCEFIFFPCVRLQSAFLLMWPQCIFLQMYSEFNSSIKTVCLSRLYGSLKWAVIFLVL